MVGITIMIMLGNDGRYKNEYTHSPQIPNTRLIITKTMLTKHRSVDLSTCDRCPEGTWSSKGATYCRPRTQVFLQWKDAHPIALLAAAAAGLLLLLAVFVVFMVHSEAPPMRRAEVRLSCVMMAGLAASFVSIVCFVGKPNTHLCRARQVLYALGFTLCMACILVKAFRTFLAFLPFGQLTHRRLYQLYNPPAAVLAVTALQGVICILWLVLDSPDVRLPAPIVQSMEQQFQCHQGSNIGFGVMLGYIALLALAGFLLAFKGRKVPQEFSETGYIIFSMLMYLFVWCCYISVYILKRDPSATVQASAILVSSYGIIFCHFLPKCYEALWRANGDTVERILRKWRMLSDGSGTSRSTCATSPAPVDPESGGNRPPPHEMARAGTVGPLKTPGIIGNRRMRRASL